MKKALSILLSAVLAFSLVGCGSILVDLDTPKSSELSSQYDYYRDSADKIRTDMKLTPEQSDEVFIVLADCGLDSKITYISENKKSGNTYHSISYSNKSFDVYLNEGTIEKVVQKDKVIYPEQEQSNSEPSPQPIEQPKNDTLETAIDSAIKSARADKEKVNILDNAGTEIPEDKNVEIFLKGKDNLSSNMIRNGMLIQANDILKSLQSRTDIAQACLFWSLNLVDSYGNTKEQNVMKILVKKETLDKINFENFDWNKLSDISDDYYEHAALTKK